MMDQPFEVTLLECIERVPGLAGQAIQNRKERTAPVLAAIAARPRPIREIQLVGSGTSNTAAFTAKYFMERSSGLPVRTILPNEYLHGLRVRDKDALVVAISQTGTSIMTRKCVDLAREAGCLTVAMCEAAGRDFVDAADAFLDMGCGHEEHPTRTIGFSLTVLTLMLLGLELGLASGRLGRGEYDGFVRQADRLPTAITQVTADAMGWLDRSRWQMLRSDAIIFTGVNSLYGVAMEASTKVWELPKLASFGYDLDEVMHGPNYGLNSRHCVIVLDDGRADPGRAQALARYMKKEFGNGLMVGPNVLDGSDLKVDPGCGPFDCLAYAAAVQIQSYRLAQDCGRDLLAPHDNHVMNSYFVSHSDYK